MLEFARTVVAALGRWIMIGLAPGPAWHSDVRLLAWPPNSPERRPR